MDTLTRLLTAETTDDFAQLGGELVPLQPLFQAEAFQLEASTTMPPWLRAWPEPMQTVFLCPDWNAWMTAQIQQWEANQVIPESHIPLLITNLVKATVCYLRSRQGR